MPNGVYRMEVQCLCENKFDVTPVTHVILDDEKNFIERIKDGSFNRFICPKCNSALRPQVVLHIEWKAKGLKFASIPEKNRYLCLSFCKDKKAAAKSGEKQPFSDDEIPLVGMWELLDRIGSISAGLETIPLEALKFLVLDGAKTKKSDMELSFAGMEDDKLNFYVVGLSDDLGLISVPRAHYEKLLIDYKNKKQKALFAALVLGPYISYKNIDTAE